MKKIYYEKIGRRYVPVSEYDSELMSSMPSGAHLIICKAGYTTRKYNIDPAYAALIAAGTVAIDKMCNALINASEVRLQSAAQKPLTQNQQDAWNNLIKEFGDSARRIEWPSANEIAIEGIKALQQEAQDLLSNKTVKKAYDQFILLCKLTKESND